MNTVFQQSTPALRNIRTVLLLCIIIIIAAISAELLLIQSLLTKRESDAQTINMAGRQRTLSQKIVKDLYAYQKDPSLLDGIHKDAKEWNNVHKSLQQDDAQKFLFDDDHGDVDSLFAYINPYQEKLYQLAVGDNILQRIDEDYTLIKDWEAQFLLEMDKLVDLYQAKSEMAIYRLEYIVRMFSLFFALLVLAMYFFFVNPIVKSMRKIAREQMAQNQNMTSILENTEDLIWSVDRNYSLLTFNSAFRERMKKEHGSLPKLKDNILDYPIDNIDKDRALYERAFAGETFSIDHKLTCNGKTTYHELSFNPIQDEDGTISGCNVFRRNETQRIVTINELKRSKETLQEAQMITKMGNWVWNITKDELHWSDELYRIFDQDPKKFDASYEGLMQIIHPADRDKFDSTVKDCMANNRRYDIVHRIVLRDGTIRHIHERGLVFYGPQGQPIRMAGTAQDVTVLENAKNKILKQYEELQNFVYIISHNVRSPISTIQGLVALFQHGDEKTSKEVVEMIGHKVDILDETIRDLSQTLSMQKVSESSFEWIEMEEMLQKIEELLQMDMDLGGVAIEYNIDPNHQVYAIKSYLMNILYNLILNAINYKKENEAPKILISTRHNPKTGEMDIMVEDNGIGMELNEEKIKKIFSMYGRLNGSSTGKGLGLFLVKTQVEAMEGKMNVVSSPERGSIFTISLKHITKNNPSSISHE